MIYLMGPMLVNVAVANYVWKMTEWYLINR